MCWCTYDYYIVRMRVFVRWERKKILYYWPCFEACFELSSEKRIFSSWGLVAIQAKLFLLKDKSSLFFRCIWLEPYIKNKGQNKIKNVIKLLFSFIVRGREGWSGFCIWLCLMFPFFHKHITFGEDFNPLLLLSGFRKIMWKVSKNSPFSR